MWTRCGREVTTRTVLGWQLQRCVGLQGCSSISIDYGGCYRSLLVLVRVLVLAFVLALAFVVAVAVAVAVGAMVGVDLWLTNPLAHSRVV